MRGMFQKAKKKFTNWNATQNNGRKGGPVPEGMEDDLQPSYTKDDLMEPLPPFREINPEHRKLLLIKKLRLASVVFDFHVESAKENLGKEIKRQMLLEMVDHITTQKTWFCEQIVVEILDMVAINIFRALPPRSCKQPWDMDEEEPRLDSAWPHLQIVYEFLLRFVISTEVDVKMLKKHITGKFVVSILELFNSEDPRERDYLKTILHRIYGRFMSMRSFVRKTINNIFYKVIYEQDRHNGIAELLEILGSIINGFALPLKQEHKKFLRNVLIPLHKVPVLNPFHQQLTICVTQFIDKDSSLSGVVLQGILRYWPVTSSTKEVLFLNELEEILELSPAEQILNVHMELFTKISNSIMSQHFQVAERALFLWNNDVIAGFTNDYREKVLPIIYPALHTNSKTHWNGTVHSLTFNLIKMFMDMDSRLFKSVSEAYQEEYENDKERFDRRAMRWKEMTKMDVSE